VIQAEKSVAPHSEVRDVAAYTFGMPEIERHMHRYNKVVPETLERQRRLWRRWELHRDALHARTRWPQDLIEEWQLERVAALVDYAYNAIPFYRELYGGCGYRTGDIVSWSDFEALPVVRKADMIAAFPDRNVLPGVDPKTCYGARTSGSTGVPMTLIQDDLSADRWMVNRMRQFEMMAGEQILPDDWIYNIYLSTWSFTSFAGAYPTFSISEDCPPAAIAAHIEMLRPKVVSVFPSFLGRLAECAGDLSRFGVRCFCTNSESSSADERRAYAEHFGAPVLDEYASEELSIIATECRYGRYHVVEDRIHVGLTNAGADGIGDIVATDTSNIYMPMIRYAQGDLIGWSGEHRPCECGNTFRFIDRFLGRADQALKSATVGRVPPDRVMNLIDRTFVSYESGIAEFRVIQRAIDLVEVPIVLRAGEISADETILARFRAGLTELFQSDLEVRVIYVPRLPHLSSHKRRMVLCEVD
jgi:phenylacetate-CoA ligase